MWAQILTFYKFYDIIIYNKIFGVIYLMYYTFLTVIIIILLIIIYNMNKTNQQYEALIYIQDTIVSQYRERFGDIEIKIDSLED